MTVKSKNVFIGAPDQATTGAILSGPTTNVIPEAIDDFSFDGLTDSGYVSADGVTITPTDTTESIKDWSGAEIRRVLTEFTGEIAWSHIELSPAAARTYFGDGHVEVTEATATNGTRLRASLGKNELPTKSWYFKIKDGNRRALIFVPRGQVSVRGEIPLTSNAPITLPVTLTTFPDAQGQNIYVFTDDGVHSA